MAPLSLLGKSFVEASLALSVLLSSSMPNVVALAVTNLAYAYEDYGLVLAIGLAQSIPRILLYILLTGTLGGLGAAIAFTVGGYAGMAMATVAARRMGFRIDYGSLAKIVLIPLAPALTLYMLHAHWLITAAAIAVSTIVGYPRTKVITLGDLREIVRALGMEEAAKKIYPRIKPLIDILHTLRITASIINWGPCQAPS